MMQKRLGLLIGWSIVAVLGCGSADTVENLSSAETGTTGDGGTNGTLAPTDVATAIEVPAPSHGEDPGVGFVFDASTDITLFPRSNYEVAACTRRDSATSELDPDSDYAGSEIVDIPTLIDSIDLIATFTVIGSFEPLTFTPVDLPASYGDETGITDGSLIRWTATPVEAVLDEVLLGEPVSTANFLEIGCFDPEVLPSTAAGQRLLVFADKVDARIGPETGMKIEIRLNEWMPVSETGVLGQRSGIFGSPPLAPFLVGQNIDDVLTEIRSAASSSSNSQPTPSRPDAAGHLACDRGLGRGCG